MPMRSGTREGKRGKGEEKERIQSLMQHRLSLTAALTLDRFAVTRDRPSAIPRSVPRTRGGFSLGLSISTSRDIPSLVYRYRFFPILLSRIQSYSRFCLLSGRLLLLLFFTRLVDWYLESGIFEITSIRYREYFSRSKHSSK